VTSALSPLLVRRATAALTATLLVLAALLTGAVMARPAGASTVEDSFTAKLNGARAARDIPRLAVRNDLVTVARAQARRMANKSVLYHNPHLTSDVNNWRWVGENVGYGPTATAVHRAFMNSAPHKANILDHDYTEVGIGVVVKDGRVWVAEVFRRPMHRASYASFTQTLHYGSKGAAVQRVQHRLGLRPTGWYGVATRRAVTHYQRGLGWSGHGNVGPKTWGHLF
jgi:Cysteine-rich secretory protein family